MDGRRSLGAAKVHPKAKIVHDGRCPFCGEKVEEEAVVHGRDSFGSYIAPYAYFECGLLVVNKAGDLQCWQPCPTMAAVEVEFTARDLTAEEIEERRRRDEKALEVWASTGRYDSVRSWFGTDTATTIDGT